jgi:chemotaxis protein MotB
MRKKGHGGGHEEGSERWLLTYADMITLLVAFFIMMYSMSVLNVQKFRQLAVSVRSGFGGDLKGDGISVIKSYSTAGSKPSVVEKMKIVKQEQQLAQKIQKYVASHGLGKDIRVGVKKRGLVISIVTDKVLFEKGQADIGDQAAHILDKLSSFIKETPYMVRVEGHTDNLPIHTAKFPSNWELSASRATAVVRRLIEKDGFPPGRLSASGFADSRPVAPNDTEEHRSSNRRVDIVLVQDEDSSAQ